MTIATAASPDLTRWRLVAAALAAALLAAMLAAVPTERTQLWLVDAGASLPAGVRVLGSLPVADALVVAGPQLPGAVPADTPVTPQTSDVLAEVDEDFVLDAVGAVGAPEVWAQGVTGAGALVAIIDTGVAPVAALAGSVAGEIDFTGTGGGDGYGHGTVVASLIAGQDGIAPDAHVLSLKVADEEGTVALISVLDALQWLDGPGKHSGVDVVITALSVPPGTKGADMLDRAVERVAKSGPVVVAPTGNEGAGQLTSPATAPAAVGVGATGVDGTATDFSGSGVDRDGKAKPDVVAPGVYVVGHTPADGRIAQENPDAMRGPEQIRGAGTSLSSALVAGTAALAASADADPARIATALRLDGDAVDAPALVAATRATAPPTPRGLVGKQLTASVTWNGAGWGNPQWNGAQLGGVRWVGVRWVGVRWVGVRWVDDSWAGVRWVDDNWAGVRWVDDSWAGVRWVGVRWVGVRWVGSWSEASGQ